MKILYLSQVSWNWIKQRPQFIAEGLASKNEVDFCYEKSISQYIKDWGKNKKSVKYKTGGILKIFCFFTIGLSKLPIIKNFKKFNNWVNKISRNLIIPNLSKYDIIWFCSPNKYAQFRTMLPSSVKVVYDCMDDFGEFPLAKKDKTYLNRIISNENSLIDRADYIFCSAETLAEVIRHRSKTTKKITVINNAIQLPSQIGIDLNDMPSDIQEKYKIICSLHNVLLYVGTIENWIDFQTIIRLLDELPQLNMVFIGPYKEKEVPIHPRIHYFGAIYRDYIFSFMRESMALIMPFVVNGLIESVNPVKLYEYIYSRKPSIAPYYFESAKFEEYVSLYNNYDELKSIITQIHNNEYDMVEEGKAISFVKNNTWSHRVILIEDILNIN